LIHVRSSFLWNLTHWKFQQIRGDAQFSYLFCLGFDYFLPYVWLIPKEKLYVKGVLQDRHGLARQHGGREGKEDAWLTIEKCNPFGEWLGNCGRRLDDVAELLRPLL